MLPDSRQGVALRRGDPLAGAELAGAGCPGDGLAGGDDLAGVVAHGLLFGAGVPQRLRLEQAGDERIAGMTPRGVLQFPAQADRFRGAGEDAADQETLLPPR
jgi:hypothetical protein